MALRDAKLRDYATHHVDCRLWHCRSCELTKHTGHHEDSYNGDTSWHEFVSEGCTCGLSALLASVEGPREDKKQDKEDLSRVDGQPLTATAELPHRPTEDVRAIVPEQERSPDLAEPIFSQPDSPDGTTLMVRVFREDDGRFAAEWQSGGEAGMGEYSATTIGALVNLVQTLLLCEEDRVLSREARKYSVAAAAPAPETEPEQIDRLAADALDRCTKECGHAALCDACALRLARAAYNAGAYNKNAAIRAAEDRVAEDARQYWKTHLDRAVATALPPREDGR